MTAQRLNSAPELNGSEPWLQPGWNGCFSEAAVNESTAICILVLRSYPYDQYLQTEHWRGVRKDVWRRQRGKCAWCKEQIAHVHHGGYERKGFERDEDVIGLCAPHHLFAHQHMTEQMWRSLNGGGQ